ncbi:MAG TPA: alpha/beta fold hydrolase [Burkholderiaceae bacterium]|nr:alpha/beta fold hydrolase [Burkholderiaceae bacterium]
MTAPQIEPRYVGTRRGRLHIACCGAAEAPAVLLLHQTPRSVAEYRAVLPLLGRRWRAIALDTPGFGASDALSDGASIEGWADAAAALLDALGVARAHVAGHHTGGVIAFELAAARPERVARLVLSSTPWIDAAERARRAQRGAIDRVEPRADGSHLAELWRRRAPVYPADRPELLHAFVLDALKVLDQVEAGHDAVTRYAMDERVALVRADALVIEAGADPFAAPHAATLVARLRHATLLRIEGGMVPLPEQMPEAFAAAVDGFLGAEG